MNSHPLSDSFQTRRLPFIRVFRFRIKFPADFPKFIFKLRIYLPGAASAQAGAGGDDDPPQIIGDLSFPGEPIIQPQFGQAEFPGFGGAKSGGDEGEFGAEAVEPIACNSFSPAASIFF